MSAEVWAIIGAAIYIGYSIGSRASMIIERLERIQKRLYDIETLVGHIPGVEDYETPDLGEWAEQRKINPEASTLNRRNWIRR